jgi:hypothetical protein
MDQEPLVTEQVEAGAKFLREFQKLVPVKHAFWLYKGDDGGWRLHVASDQITDKNLRAAYGKVVRAARTFDDPWFDTFLVKLIGADDPLAKAAADAWRRYPNWTGGRFPGDKFGKGVEGVYLYPQAVTTL